MCKHNAWNTQSRFLLWSLPVDSNTPVSCVSCDIHIKSWCGHDGVSDDTILLFFPAWFQNVHFNCIVNDSLYYYIDIGTMWHFALLDFTPSQSIGLVLLSALFWCWLSLCVPFIISLIECYFIMMVAATVGKFIAIRFILNCTFGLSVTR